MSDSVRPHRWQPTRLPHPWDSPGKNAGEGCHFLLQCMKVKSESEVAQSCPTLHNLMNCSLRGSSIHGIFQTRVLEWGAIAFSSFVAKYNHIWSRKSPLQYSCLENSTDRGAFGLQPTGLAKSQTQLKQLNIHTHVIISHAS